MWTIDQLNQYIEDQIEESIYLDYKAADSLGTTDGRKNEISKDVSAFANSDGGTIIYGIREFQEGAKYLPEKIDSINRFTFSRETLEQVINTRISPKLHGVIITPITIGHPEDNQVVYVVEIPKANTAHQASDKRYYRRYNFQSIPMDDWEIKDIINRENKAIVDVYFRPRFPTAFFDFYISEKRTKMSFDIIATNVGNKVVKYVDCLIMGKEEVSYNIIPIPNLLKERNYFELYFSNEVEYKITLEENEIVINTQRMAILPQTYRRIGEIEIYSDFFIDNQQLRLTIALDDNRISKKVSGKNIIDI